MTEQEQRTIYAALLRGIAVAARLERRQALADYVGLPADQQAQAADLAEMRRHMRHAELELEVSRTRARAERRRREGY